MHNEMAHETDNQGIKPIVLVDKKKPQFFNFDQGLVANERMIEKMLPVTVKFNEQALLTATSAVSISQLRITVPKKTLLLKGESVSLDFTTLFSKLKKTYFLNVAYEVFSIEAFSYVNHVLLVLSKQANPEFIAWFKQWLKSIGQVNKYEENNDKLFNCMFSYYKRLYCVYLAYPMIFSDAEGIKLAFLSNEALNGIDFSNGQRANARLSVNVFDEYMSDQKLGTRIPLYVWYEHEELQYISGADVPKVSPKQIIGWLKTKKQWRVLLLRTRTVKAPESSQIDAIQKYTHEKILGSLAAFKESFAKLTAVTSVLDISNVFEQITLEYQNLAVQGNQRAIPARGVSYSTLSFKMKRIEARFSYSTRVQLATMYPSELVVEAVSIDLSLLGLSIKIPYMDFPFSVKDPVLIDFTEWNEVLVNTSSFFKKNPKLHPVEYVIKNIDQNDEFILIGLFRHSRDTDSATNFFIQNKLIEIKRDTAGVRRNDLDLYHSFYASVWLTNNIAGLPFFLGHDAEGIRIIQAIANTEENLSLRKPFLINNDWSFLQQIATTLSVAVRELQADRTKPLKLLSCGIYCYFEERNSDTLESGWKTKTDMELTTPELKQPFIEEAMRHPMHYFYHCSLVSIKNYKDDIFNSEVVEFMSKVPHRVIEMHELCNALLAIGELNEITRLIEFMYKN